MPEISHYSFKLFLQLFLRVFIPILLGIRDNNIVRVWLKFIVYLYISDYLMSGIKLSRTLWDSNTLIFILVSFAYSKNQSRIPKQYHRNEWRLQ